LIYAKLSLFFVIEFDIMVNSKKLKGVDENFDYKTYWNDRYISGANSGTGSY
jgi:hypothetical protein